MDLFESVKIPEWVINLRENLIIKKEYNFRISKFGYENRIENNYIALLSELCSSVHNTFDGTDYVVTYPDIEDLKHRIAINKNNCINGFTKCIDTYRNNKNKQVIFLNSRINFYHPNLDDTIYSTIENCVKNSAIATNNYNLASLVLVEEDKLYTHDCDIDVDVGTSITIHVPCKNPICTEGTKEYLTNAWIEVSISVTSI